MRQGRTTGRGRGEPPGAVLAAVGLVGVALGLAAHWLPSSFPALGFGAPPHAHPLELALALALLVMGGVLLLHLRRRGRAVLRERDAALHEAAWRLDFALGASEVGFWDVDLATDALVWDDRARSLFGVPSRTGYFSETDWIAAIHPEDRARALAAAHAAVAAGERFVSDYRVVWPDGQVRHLRDMAAFYVAPDGSRRLSGLVWDVTADKAREAELELRRLEAEAANDTKSSFLAALSHEIRTPLAGVLGMLDLMLAEPLPATQAERARIARTSAQSLLLLLNDVLDLSKLQAAAIVLHPAPVRPREALREVTELMAARAEQKGLALTCEVAAGVPDWVTLDAGRLRQVLTNLVSNAITFTDAGRVAVTADHRAGDDGGRLLIAVADTGVGIPEADRERIFERFVQADSSFSRRSGGTGLGLAIARQLVELMGGTLTVESAEGTGSTFRFAVRAAPAAAPADAEAPTPPAEPGPPPMRLLVAEDNPTNQYLIRALLAPAGHALTVVEDGAAAVAAARCGDFDAVLMDVQMPDMDGPSAARAIRRLPPPAGQVPIIALTASVLPGDRARYAAAGMTDHVAKPIDRAALDRALARAAADRRPAEAV